MNNEFHVGVGSADISPEDTQLFEVVGVHNKWPMVGVMRDNPLTVDAVAFQAGGRIAIVATYDATGHGRKFELETRAAVAEKVGCAPERVLISVRHNHSSRAVPRDRESAEAKTAIERYRKKIRDGITDACAAAAAGLRPAEMVAGTARPSEPIGQCRRMRFSHGGCTPAWNTGPIAIPGQKLVGPPGPHPDRIDFLCAREPGASKPFALLTSYAAHVHLAGMPYFNGEVPGGIRNEVRRRIPGLTIVYANSTAGDADMHCTHPMPLGGQEAELAWFRRSVATLADRFVDALLGAIPTSGYGRPERMGHVEYRSDPPKRDRTRRTYMVNALALGDTALVSIPGEMFNEFGEMMHADCPFPHLVLIGYQGSGGLGYVGTPLAYERGGYETNRGPAPSPEEEARIIASGERSRIVGRARVDTGVEITARVKDVLAELAGSTGTAHGGG